MSIRARVSSKIFINFQGWRNRKASTAPFPIALHPNQTWSDSNDSEQVLALLTNRPAASPALLSAGDFGEAAPFTPRSGTRRNFARGYSSPSLLYQDFFRIACAPNCP